jgi:hypothetical protein
MHHRTFTLVAGFGFAAMFGLAAPGAFADCRLEIELLGTDLKGVQMTEPQKQRVAPLIDEALKRCRVAREAASLEYIAKARRAAGIEERDDAPDPPPRKP